MTNEPLSTSVYATSPATKQLHAERWRDICAEHDRIVASLLFIQWLACIAVACWVSPLSTTAGGRSVHPNVLITLLVGGSIAAFPISTFWLYRGTQLSRHTLAVGQMLFSALLIHLLNGRIEAHFHVFGSLALLAFYRGLARHRDRNLGGLDRSSMARHCLA